MRNSHFNSCGHIGEWTLLPNKKGEPVYQQLGCWCWLPAAAQIPEKTCWLDARRIEGGWGEFDKPPAPH